MSEKKRKIIEIKGKRSLISSTTSDGKQIEYPTPIILIDTREKNPFRFIPINELGGVEVATLAYGDYAIKGYPDLITIERKASSLELYGNIGKNRDRFIREIEAMNGCRFKFIVVEDTLESLLKSNEKARRMSGGKFRHFNSSAILGSLVSIQLKYNVSVVFAGNRDLAQQTTRRLLIKSYEYLVEGEYERVPNISDIRSL